MTQRLPDKKLIARSFSRKAGSYGAHARAQRDALQRLVAHLPAAPHSRGLWLDLGSGPGLFETMLPPNLRPVRMVCLDIAPGALRTLNELGLGWVRSVQGDIEALPFRSGCCDGVVVASVLQWTGEPARTLARCARLLRPGGRLLFSVFLTDYLRELAAARTKLFGAGLPISLPSRTEITRAVTDAGLELRRQEHLREVLYFSSAMAVIKHLAGAGATATAQPAGHPTRLFELCRTYEERYRTAQGVAATSDILVGMAARRE